MIAKTVSCSIVFALALAAAGPSGAAGDAAAGKAKSATCAGCHGADGNSANTLWPKIAGQHPEYISKQLNDFKGGRRMDPMMAPMAAPLSDQDVADLSAYFSQQTLKPGAAKANLVSMGQKLYRGGDPDRDVSACIACHGPTGKGNPLAGFPAVGGQHADYIAKSLKDFRAGTRKNDAAHMMRDIASRMSEEQINAVASFIAGLH